MGYNPSGENYPKGLVLVVEKWYIDPTGSYACSTGFPAFQARGHAFASPPGCDFLLLNRDSAGSILISVVLPGLFLEGIHDDAKDCHLFHECLFAEFLCPKQAS
jgi:hypothetical protein